ncbi:MAG: sialate O-acetylesterase, partial [Lachnospiraceae bacterium]|nr:sialate O-acetylesterase [Lachnospiraceae bacterium]
MLRLPEIFQSNMVLQYNHPVKVWGMSDPAESVQIEIQSQSISAVSDEQGNWQVLLEPLEISYDESLTVRTSKEEWRAEHVAVGAVWIAGGQSNMEFFMKYEKHYEEELENCENALLRFFDVPKIAFDGQRETFDYSEYAVWRDCNRENLGYFSAVGYYFQKMIAERLKMPVGIIGCNWGGTTASVWMSEETLERLDNVWFHQYRERTREIDWTHYYEEEKKNPENNKGALYHDAFNEFFMSRTPAAEEAEEFFKDMPPYDLNHMQPQTVPGCLFEHMLKSIAPYTVTGVLWYQGESDDEAVGQQEIYQVMLRSMIEDWRKELDCPDLPFLIVQLPGFKKWLFVENQDWSKIRKAQESVADADENVMLCSISDAGEEW